MALWNKQSLRFDFCSKQRQNKAGCDSGRETDCMEEDGTLGGLGIRNAIVNLDCMGRFACVLSEPYHAPPPALFCVPRPAHSDFLTYWLRSRLGQWEEVEGVGTGKPLVVSPLSFLALLVSPLQVQLPPPGLGSEALNDTFSLCS